MTTIYFLATEPWQLEQWARFTGTTSHDASHSIRRIMVGSMGRVGAAGDSAAMESFFALLQKNVLNRQCWTTREQLRIAIVTWIEKTYHRR